MSEKNDLKMVKIEDLTVGKTNPRKDFEPVALQELADSIKEIGMIEPVVARPKGKKWQIAVGERRYRAAKIAGVKEIPVLIRDLTDLQVMKIQLTENLLREDLNALEEAQALHALRQKAKMKEADIAEMLGKSQAWVSDRIRILRLPKELQKYIPRGMLGPAHAKVLLRIKDPKDQLAIAKQLERWDQDDRRRKIFNPSVRETERAVENFLERQEKQMEFQNVMKAAKVKKCPKCGKKAIGLSQKFQGTKILTCSDWNAHHWDPKTGELVMAPWEAEEEERKLKARKDAVAARKKALGGHTHVPTMPAWFFSTATKQQWAEALLKEQAENIRRLSYGPSAPWSGDLALRAHFRHPAKNIIKEEIAIVPVTLVNDGITYGTKVTIGSYRSTRSKDDNLVRGEEDVEKVRGMIRKLLSFQARKVGVKQAAKTVMPKEVNGFKFGAKVKVKKDFTIKSYRGAGAEIVGFTESGQAILNYSKADKVIHTSYLEDAKAAEKGPISVAGAK